jgi:hypothetical protein
MPVIAFLSAIKSRNKHYLKLLFGVVNEKTKIVEFCV